MNVLYPPGAPQRLLEARLQFQAGAGGGAARRASEAACGLPVSRFTHILRFTTE